MERRAEREAKTLPELTLADEMTLMLKYPSPESVQDNLYWAEASWLATRQIHLFNVFTVVYPLLSQTQSRQAGAMQTGIVLQSAQVHDIILLPSQLLYVTYV